VTRRRAPGNFGGSSGRIERWRRRRRSARGAWKIVDLFQGLGESGNFTENCVEGEFLERRTRPLGLKSTWDHCSSTNSQME
jgi:hypothetical protein